MVINGSEDWAFMDDTGLVGDCALLDTSLKSINIPAIQEVAVKSVTWTNVSDWSWESGEEEDTSRVTLCKDELPTIKCDLADAVQDLIEQMHKLNWIPWRAGAIVDGRHVGYVAAVWQVLIDAVPARLELYLSTETIVAVSHVHLW